MAARITFRESMPLLNLTIKQRTHNMNAEIIAYNTSRTDETTMAICDRLATIIDEELKEAESKVWHRHPVWFLDGNPVVGYCQMKEGVRLLFWSGQSFDEDALVPEGSFKAAEFRIHTGNDIKITLIRRWLKKARTIQWDYKHIVKRKGKLERLK